MGPGYSKLITIFHEKFVKRVIFSQPNCIGKKDFSSASVHPPMTSKMDTLSKVSRYVGKCVKQLGLFNIERELDSDLSPKSGDAFVKFIQKVD